MFESAIHKYSDFEHSKNVRYKRIIENFFFFFIIIDKILGFKSYAT